MRTQFSETIIIAVCMLLLGLSPALATPPSTDEARMFQKLLEHLHDAPAVRRPLGNQTIKDEQVNLYSSEDESRWNIDFEFCDSREHRTKLLNEEFDGWILCENGSVAKRVSPTGPAKNFTTGSCGGPIDSCEWTAFIFFEKPKAALNCHTIVTRVGDETRMYPLSSSGK